MGFFAENWLWRGTQSAIFYYVSGAPCIEWKYKRKRRNEANRAQKQREEIVVTQPGCVQQPGAFQTNEAWAEEILIGPGPPKGWKRDPIAEKFANGNDKSYGGKTSNSLDGISDQARQSESRPIADSRDMIPIVSRSSHQKHVSRAEGENPPNQGLVTTNSATTNNTRLSVDSTSTASSSSSNEERPRPRPSLERRLSTAMDNIKDTLRSTMRPENWNWIRYERDDEILSGFNQRMSEMWNKATNFASTDKADAEIDTTDIEQGKKRRKRADTDDREHFDYRKYTRNPEVNDLHPPVVSRLPTTRDDAAWMMLPPPSAAIMEGKARPQDETAMRWPLARIGRTPQDWKKVSQTQRIERSRTGSGRTESIPELSDSFTEASSIDEDRWQPGAKRHSAPLIRATKPAELDLVYVNGRRLPDERPGLLTS